VKRKASKGQRTEGQEIVGAQYIVPSDNMRKRNKAYICALTAVFFWSTVASAFKISLRYLSVVELLFYSSVVSAAALFLILTVQKKTGLIRRMQTGDYLFSGLLGFLNPFFYYLVLFKAYSLLPAQQAQPLNMIWGIVLVLISIPLLKQKVRFVDMAALLTCFFGVVVISTGGDFAGMHFTNPPGVFLAVGSSVIWSFYWILNVKDNTDSMVRLFLNFTAGSIYILPFFLFHWRMPPWEGLLGAVYIGLFEMGITFFLWITALKLTDRTVNVVILIYFVPFISFVFIHVLVGETILFSSVAGAILIVLGTSINKYKEFKKEDHG
jgi:drug/metabolite transporter (DMT)-like permease